MEKKNLFSAFLVFGLIAISFLTVLLVQQKQDVRQNAQVSGVPLIFEEINTAATGSQEDSFLYLNGRLFLATWNSPARLIRYNQPLTNLSDQTSMVWPQDGLHNQAQSMVVNSNGKILVTFKLSSSPNGLLHDPGQITVDEVDPETLSTRTVINTTDGVTSRVGSNGPSLVMLGDYLYILTDGTFSTESKMSNSQILKYDTRNWSRVGILDLVGLTDGHALETDGVALYATGYTTNAWFAKINPTTMTYSSIALDPDQDSPTDDFALFGGYAWVGFETGEAIGSVVRISTADLNNRTRITTGVPFTVEGLFALNGKLWVLWANLVTRTLPGHIGVIDPNTLAVSTRQLDPGYVAPNEFVTDGTGHVWIAGWTSPVWVARGTLIPTSTPIPVSPTKTSTPTPTAQATLIPIPTSTQTPTPTLATGKTGDLNGDNLVGITDLSILLSNWGLTNPTNPKTDINRDGSVGIVDLSMLLSNWGT